MLALHRLPLPVLPEVGSDEARAAGVFRREAVEVRARMRNRLAVDKTPYLRMPRTQWSKTDSWVRYNVGWRKRYDDKLNC